MKPFIANPIDWFAELDRSRQGSFFESAQDRNQPITPCRDILQKYPPESDGTIN